MIKPKSICSQCRRPKKEDCEICVKKPFEGINKDNYPFYNSRIWRNISKAYKQRNPLCIECLQNGKTTLAEVTDHIIPIDKGGSKTDTNNLQSLCHNCHNKKSGRSK